MRSTFIHRLIMLAAAALLGFTFTGEALADSPQERYAELAESSRGVVVAEITQTSMIADTCQVFFGARYDVEETLEGDTPRESYRILSDVADIDVEGCTEWTEIPADVELVSPRYNVGQKVIIFVDSDAGDVTLPYSRIQQVKQAI